MLLPTIAENYAILEISLIKDLIKVILNSSHMNINAHILSQTALFLIFIHQIYYT